MKLNKNLVEKENPENIDKVRNRVSDIRNRLALRNQNESLNEEVSDGWDKVSDLEDWENISADMNSYVYEVNNAIRGVYTHAYTYSELADKFRELADNLNYFASLVEGLKDDEDNNEDLDESFADYFVIEINNEIYSDEFGNPYHFNNPDEAQEFIEDNELEGAEVIAQYGESIIDESLEKNSLKENKEFKNIISTQSDSLLDMEDKAQIELDPAFGDAQRYMKKSGKIRDDMINKAIKNVKSKQGPIALNPKRTEAQKKMHLSESLFSGGDPFINYMSSQLNKLLKEGGMSDEDIFDSRFADGGDDFPYTYIEDYGEDFVKKNKSAFLRSQADWELLLYKLYAIIEDMDMPELDPDILIEYEELDTKNYINDNQYRANLEELKDRYIKEVKDSLNENLNESWNQPTVGEIKDMLQNALDTLDNYDDGQFVNIVSNTYFLDHTDLFLGLASRGYLDLNNPVKSVGSDGDFIEKVADWYDTIDYNDPKMKEFEELLHKFDPNETYDTITEVMEELFDEEALNRVSQITGISR